MKDKNAIIGFLLIFAVIIIFSIINKQLQENVESKNIKTSDTLKNAQQDTLKKEVQKLEIKEYIPPKAETAKSEDTEQSDTIDLNYPFQHATIGKEEIYVLTNNLLKIGISTYGGKIDKVELLKYKKWDKKTPLLLINKTLDEFGLKFFSSNRFIETNKLFFEPYINGNKIEKGQIFSTSEENPNVELRMRLYAFPPQIDKEKSQYIEYIYTITHNSYEVGFDIHFHHSDAYISENTTFLNFDITLDAQRQEKNLENERNNSTIYYRFWDDEVDYLSERKDDSQSLKTKIHWIAFKQQFFSFALINKNGFEAGKIESFVDVYKASKDTNYLKTNKASMIVPFQVEKNKKFSIPMNFYLGPNSYKLLSKMDIGLERQVPIGWGFFLFRWINTLVVIPLFNYLEGFGWNYGVIILILTLLLKIVLFPLAYKTYLSSARIRVLKPEIEEISKKYPKKEDMLKKQQEISLLYKRAGVNPMAGCLPMLLQLPILIALFRFFPASIELRQQPFLWADDLSTYDSILELGFNIPFYGSHVSLFTLLMTISTIIYTYLNSKTMDTSSQMPGMKVMMYIMPIMFLGFFNSFSAALSYYYLLTNLFAFAQMFIFNLLVDEKKIRQRIEENKQKPIKISTWQQRLEEFAKKKRLEQKKYYNTSKKKKKMLK